MPSELQHLRWSEVEWTGGKYPNGTITITSPKTAHCGKASRVVPLLPELRPWLRDAFDAALEASGTLPEFVIARCQGGSPVNLRSGFQRIIEKAGLKPWPKLYVNLRASRATELAEQYPGHTAAEWPGHTEAVANEHYRQVTAEHYARAATVPTGLMKEAVQNPVQHRAPGEASTGTLSQGSKQSHEKSPDISRLFGKVRILAATSSAPCRGRTIRDFSGRFDAPGVRAHKGAHRPRRHRSG